MATAVETQKSSTPVQPANPLMNGATGAVLILAGLFVALYGLPQIWNSTITPLFAAFRSVDTFLKLIAQLSVVAGFVALGNMTLGTNPAKGTRGAIGMILAMVVGLFFIVRAVGMNFEPPIGPLATLVVLGGLLGLSYRYLTSVGGQKTMVTIEEQGIFSLFNYKRNQGIKARRFTMIGLIIIGVTGIYSLTNQSVLEGNWVVNVPYTEIALTLLTDLRNSLPLALGLVVFWLSWRVVNMPAFADFLIATEAEMYKVSWSSRKRLIQDTIVVLVFVILMTVFLMVVDFFWGWVLSLRPIGVLPEAAKPNTQEVIDPIQGRQSKW
ncbi:MAG: preprotein translocase subunit SecE [Fimbriiglobus sp.]